MALTLPVYFRAILIDELNVQAEIISYAVADPSATATTLLGFLTSWTEDVAAMTDGAILSASMALMPALPTTIATVAAAGSRAAQTGVLNFYATGTARRWGIAVPALSNDPTVTSGGQIVLTGGSPADVLRTLLLEGSSVLEFSNNTQQVLASFADSYISFRERNKQTIANTYER